MARYIMRIDDAAPYADWEKWERMEQLMERYGISPLIGVIPHCQDPELMLYDIKEDFWGKVCCWQERGWIIAMHGYDHVYISCNGGFNPVNKKSEFAGVPIEVQKKKIRDGLYIFKEHGIEPEVFFPPSHTMDENTIEALKQESKIRVVSDTIASAPYSWKGMVFVPQQSGKVRKLPLKMVTFCYHPNAMSDSDFIELEIFLRKWKNKFISFPLGMCGKHRTIYDYLLKKLYFCRR